MDDTKPLSQVESKKVADYLRSKYSISPSYALYFWRMSPDEIVRRVKKSWQVDVSSGEIAKAAGRAA